MPSSRCFCQPGTASQQGLSFQPGAVSSTRLFPAQGLFPARGSFQPRGCFQHWALFSPGFFPAICSSQRALSRQRRLPEPGLFPTRGFSNCSGHFPPPGLFQRQVVSSHGGFPARGCFQGWALHPKTQIEQIRSLECNPIVSPMRNNNVRRPPALREGRDLWKKSRKQEEVVDVARKLFCSGSFRKTRVGHGC